MKRFAIYAAICLVIGIMGAVILSMVSARQFESSKSQVAVYQEAEPTPIPTTQEEKEESGSKPTAEVTKKPNNVASGGQACKINPDCDLLSEYCSKSKCGDESGVCKKKPTSCANDFLVVCSCDGKTYSNECNALKNGSNVKGPGAC